MLTLLAQVFGWGFILALLYVMVTECRACAEDTREFAPRKIRFQTAGHLFDRIVSCASQYRFIKR